MPTIQHDLDQDLIDSANSEDSPAVVAFLIAQGADPKAQRSHALLRAAINGHVETVKLLIPLSDPRAGSSSPLRMAAASGRADCVRLLIPVSNPKDVNSGALAWAAANGHAECAKLLIPVSTPLTQNPQALNLAIAGGHAQVASIMLLDDPPLLESLRASGRLSIHRDAAVGNGHLGLAALLDSIIDLGEICSAAGDCKPCRPRLSRL